MVLRAERSAPGRFPWRSLWSTSTGLPLGDHEVLVFFFFGGGVVCLLFVCCLFVCCLFVCVGVVFVVVAVCAFRSCFLLLLLVFGSYSSSFSGGFEDATSFLWVSSMVFVCSEMYYGEPSLFTGEGVLLQAPYLSFAWLDCGWTKSCTT